MSLIEKRDELSHETQLDKFKAAARDLECDDSETHWDERLKKVVKAKSVDKIK